MSEKPTTKRVKPATNEEWVRAWLSRKWGKQFVETHEEDAAKLREHLDEGVLLEADPAEGIGTCTCGVETGKDIRFLLDPYEFMSICVRCDSWSVYRTREGKRRPGKE